MSKRQHRSFADLLHMGCIVDLPLQEVGLVPAIATQKKASPLPIQGEAPLPGFLLML